MTSLWHHGLWYDVIGFPYIRCRAWPAGASYLTWELRVHFALVPSSTAGYSCMLGSTHWCIPASGAYFLQLYLIGLLLLRVSSRVLTPQKTHRHIPWVLSRVLRAPSTQDWPPFGWCPWALFRLYQSTSSEAYRHRGDTSSSRVAYITYIGLFWPVNYVLVGKFL